MVFLPDLSFDPAVCVLGGEWGECGTVIIMILFEPFCFKVIIDRLVDRWRNHRGRWRKERSCTK